MVVGLEVCSLTFDDPFGLFDLGFDFVIIAWKELPRLVVLSI